MTDFHITYERCVREKQKALLSPTSCENLMPAEGADYPCSSTCPCALRDALIVLYEATRPTAVRT